MSKLPKIFVINLEKSVERKKIMEKQLETSGLDYEIYNAVDGNELSKDELNNYYSDIFAKRIINRSLSREEIGCYLSHLDIYKKILEEKLQYAVILEDDILIGDELRTVCTSLIDSCRHWDLVQLYYSHSCFYFWYNQYICPKYSLRKIVNIPWGSAAYLLSRKAAEKILEKSMPVYLPIDDFIYRKMKHSIRIRALEPLPFNLMPTIEVESTMSEREIIKTELMQNIKFVDKLIVYIANNMRIFCNKFNPFNRIY